MRASVETLLICAKLYAENFPWGGLQRDLFYNEDNGARFVNRNQCLLRPNTARFPTRKQKISFDV